MRPKKQNRPVPIYRPIPILLEVVPAGRHKLRGETYRLQNVPKISCAAGRRCGERGEVEVEQECSDRFRTNTAV
jgi:hypothetical protein